MIRHLTEPLMVSALVLGIIGGAHYFSTPRNVTSEEKPTPSFDWRAQLADEERIISTGGEDTIFYDFDGKPGFDGYVVTPKQGPILTRPKRSQIYVSSNLDMSDEDIAVQVTQPKLLVYDVSRITPDMLAEENIGRMNHYRMQRREELLPVVRGYDIDGKPGIDVYTKTFPATTNKPEQVEVFVNKNSLESFVEQTSK